MVAVVEQRSQEACKRGLDNSHTPLNITHIEQKKKALPEIDHPLCNLYRPGRTLARHIDRDHIRKLSDHH